jgi:glycosyltransferase involved in cell wall biosynthesis
VIIPARNEGKRIGRLVQAVLAQARSAGPVEVLVLDDDSSDDTVARA